jgi:hypothetical protein
MLFRSVLVLGLVAGCLVTVPRVAAQELPRAEDILDRAAEAVAGKAVRQKTKTTVMRGKVSVQGMSGRYASYQAAPNRRYEELSIDGLLTMEAGVSGDLAWERSSITGARVLKGGERAMALREAHTGGWRSLYKRVRTLAEEKVEGRPAYKVELTTREGEVVIAHYDRQSGLLVRQEVTVASPEGRTNYVQFFSDYRRVDGVAYAFRTRILVGSAEVVLTIERVEHNVAIPDSRFAVPADVQRLLARHSKS